MSDGFDENVQDELKHYVYLLCDPDSKIPFYVGKGQGNRVFRHADDKLATDDFDENQDEISKKNKRSKKEWEDARDVDPSAWDGRARRV